MKKGNVVLLGTVVADIEAKIENCVKYLGVAPESIVLKKHRITPDFHYGLQKSFYIDLAILPLTPNVGLELISPVEGDDNDYAHFLNMTGASGVHHVNLDCDLYEFGDKCRALGAKRMIWNPDESYTYFDTRDLLGVKTECADLTRFTPDETPETKSWDTQTHICKIGVVCRDVYKKAKMYQLLLGAEKKDCVFMTDLLRKEVQNGKEMDIHVNAAYISLPDVVMELIDPLDEYGVFYEFLTKYGEGVHNIVIDNDIAAFDKKMKEAQISESFAEQGGLYRCYNTDEIIGFKACTVRW